MKLIEMTYWVRVEADDVDQARDIVEDALWESFGQNFGPTEAPQVVATT